MSSPFDDSGKLSHTRAVLLFMSDKETLEDKIRRILRGRRIEIGVQEAAAYADALLRSPENTLIPMTGRHRALRLNRAGVVSSVSWRPPSDASRMRVSPMNGPMPEDQSSMVTEGPRPLTGAMLIQDVTLSASSFADILPRESLGQVMGGSATQLSGVQNSEWLHMIAHSLGGQDTPANIVAGPHSLNTAMIPFERLVRSAARQGRMADYRVTFFSDEMGDVSYVHHVEISISFQGGQTGTWTLEVNRESIGEFINGQVLADIERTVEAFGNRASQ